jgi:hypothetical protein
METPQRVGMETPQRVGMEYVKAMNMDVPEPKTPAMHSQQIADLETPQRVGMEYVQAIKDVPEPKTPAMHLKFDQAEELSNSFKARSVGIKVACLSLKHILSIYIFRTLTSVMNPNPTFFYQKSVVQECLTFLNSANK